MCDDNNKENEENLVSQGIHILTDNIEGFQIQDQSQLMMMQQQQNTNHHLIGGVRRGSCVDPVVGSTSTLVSFPQWSIPNNQVHAAFNDPFLLIPPPPPPPPDLFNRRLQFGYDVVGSSDHHLTRLFSDHGGAASAFGLHAELQKMSAQEIMDAKALAASKSHSEAERRRRERINNHLAKLRSLLPSTTKTDKASLLAEVIQHVKELKRQTCLIAETSLVPTETDELTVDNACDEDGAPLIKASICCEDRSDLLPDLIKTLKALRLRTLKAEITTLGGRVKNVLFITGDQEQEPDDNGEAGGGGGGGGERYCIGSIQEALRAVMEKSNGDESSAGSGSVKRQRTNVNIL